jgi:hypothetical protein
MNHFRHTLHGFFLIRHAVAESLLPGYARGDADELTTGSLVASTPGSVLDSAQAMALGSRIPCQ